MIVRVSSSDGACIHGRSLHPWTRCDDCGPYCRTI
jgi:hypothetical protein